jgi:hypothetical protein
MRKHAKQPQPGLGCGVVEIRFEANAILISFASLSRSDHGGGRRLD